MSKIDREVRSIYHRTKQVDIFPIGGDRFLISAFLQDEIHDVHTEVEIVHPSLEIVAARSEIRNGPFTNVCNMTHPNIENLIGMRVEAGFTGLARKRVGGRGGCHRVSELVVEIAQAAYQLHFVRHFSAMPKAIREAEDNPGERHKSVLASIPGMRNTCFSYDEDRTDLIASKAGKLKMREQEMPTRLLRVEPEDGVD
ncbi:MAG TPA: DUF2889 domain-containing protein [Myxococcales bacterium]|nr:DUF2889 domain-containing protein [Myxococcales bacterium]HIL79824.1 DUF2889 domain-containing protein [Myxococcales bacterium]